MKYVWTVLKNLIVLGIAIAILEKAGSDYERIVFSLLVLIYLSIDWSMTWHKMITAKSAIALDMHFWHIRKLLHETHKGEANPYMNILQESEEFRKPKSEEEQIAEVEKEMGKEQINFYIEAGFKSIIFFLALLNLLIGLDIV